VHAASGVTLTSQDGTFVSRRRAPELLQYPVAGRRGFRPLVSWIVFGVLSTVIAIHATGLTGGVTYTLVIVSAMAAALVGIRVNAPTVRWPWYAIVATGLFWAAAGAIADATGSNGDLTENRSLLSDMFAIPGYVLFGIAIHGLIRARRTGRERGAFTDGLMLAAGAALLVHEALIAPMLGNTDIWIMARLAIAVYPVASMVLLVLSSRLAFGDGERSVAFRLLLFGNLCLFVGDIVFAFGELGRLAPPQAVLEVPYLLIPTSICAATLHPSVRRVTHAAIDPTHRLGAGRLAAVAAALLAPILILAVNAEPTNRTVTVLLATALVGTAIFRIGSAMREQAHAESALYHQATHDELTGLPARNLLVEKTDELLHTEGCGVALMFIDIDQFKFVNDSMGHTAGDELLVHVADRLTRIVREEDIVGRISGDEFVIVAAGLDSIGAHALADRVRNVLRDPFELTEGEVFVSASVGVTLADAGPEASATTLLQEADTAMYRSKEAGRNTTTLFDGSMREQVSRRVELERLLRHALDRREITLAFQPIVRAPGVDLDGFEALVRWRVGDEQISPAEFIPIAEESGLIVPLGAYVLDEACRHLAWWRTHFPAARNAEIAVNLSPRQMRAGDVVDMVAETLERHGLPGEALWLEITESVMLEDSVATTAVLSGIRALGVRLAVDDFGTGFSSLSYLKRFPVSKVKIDRSFVSGLGSHESDSSLVSAIVAMAAALGLDLVAEGVETEEQARRLLELGCAQMQGYHFARPMDADDVTTMLHERGQGRREVRSRRCQGASPRH
jgi:diguanylate cyclase (GGDEF)-like protein